MGIFSSNKTCPICGGEAKGLLKVKIKDNIVLCSNCTSLISMDDNLIRHQSVEDMKKHIEYRKQNQKLFDNFELTQEIHEIGYFRIDERNKLWYYTKYKNVKNPPLFRFDEIIDYSLKEECETIVKDGKAKSVIISMIISISLNNPYHSHLEIELLPKRSQIEQESFIYKAHKKTSRKFISVLDRMTANSSKEYVPQNTATTIINTASGAQEIKQYKELLDEGIITQEEFDAKKKQLLGL